MFASNQQVENFNSEEFLNWLTEEQTSFWEPNHVEISSSNYTPRNQSAFLQQQKGEESVQCQIVSNNDYEPPTLNQNLEVSKSPTATLQPSSYTNNQCTDRSEESYYTAQVPYMGTNLSSIQHYRTTNKYHRINHRGNIIIGPTSSGGYKAIVKRKRKRTIFTTEQVEVLETIFSKKPYITRDDRQYIVNQLHLSDKSVKIWFQNRRLKGKRLENEANEDAMEENEVVDSDSLDHVESEIQKNTDEFGYVTLDDRIMGDLVNIIDTCLTRNSDIEISSTSDIVETSECSFYEPISPASSDHSLEQELTTRSDWEAFEPSESLQRLLDLQSLIQV